MSGEEKNDDSIQFFNNSSSELVKPDEVGGLVISNNADESLEKTSVDTELIMSQNIQNDKDQPTFNQPSTADELINNEYKNENSIADTNDRSSVASFRQTDSDKNEVDTEPKNEIVTVSTEDQSSYPTTGDNINIQQPGSVGESSTQEEGNGNKNDVDTEPKNEIVTVSTEDQSYYPTTGDNINIQQPGSVGESSTQEEGNGNKNENSNPESDHNSSSVSLNHSHSKKNDVESVHKKDNLSSVDQHSSYHSNQYNPTADQSNEERRQEELGNGNTKSTADDNSNGVPFKQPDLDNNDAEFHQEKDVVRIGIEEETSSSNKYDSVTTDQLSASDETSKQELTNITQNENPQSVLDGNNMLSKQSDSDNNEADGVKHKTDSDVDSAPWRVPDVETSESMPLNAKPGSYKESVAAVKSDLESKTDQVNNPSTEHTNEISPSNTDDPKSENSDYQKEKSTKGDSTTGANSKEQTPTKTMDKSNKLVVENRALTKLKSQRERKGSATRDITRKMSTPRNSTIKKEEHKPSISRDNKKPLPARKLGVDHSKERPNQLAPFKDANARKSSVTNKSVTVNNQGAETSKESQFSDKGFEKKHENLKSEQTSSNRGGEKKQQLPQSRKNSAAEVSSSAQEHDNKVTKESGQQVITDQKVTSDTSYTVVNEKEERKKSPKVKWNEKTLQPKALPNGNVKSSENNQEENKQLKTETDLENERNLSNRVEKGKHVAIIEEGGESMNDKDKEAFNPKSILARAVWKKGGKDKSGAGFVAMNGPAKSHSKASLAVRSVSTVDEKDDKLSMESRRDSTLLSLDSVSHKSIDFRNTTTTNNPIPEEKPRSLLHNDSWIRSAIPYQPLSLSILCLIMNIFLPGTGTFSNSN